MKTNDKNEWLLELLTETGYFDELFDVIKVRLERKKQYGDQWKEMELWELLALIKQKYGRLEHLTKKLFCEKDEGEYEKVEDTLIDLINYSLFMLWKVKNDNKKINDKNEKVI